MKVQPVRLDAVDAVEFGELLEFLGRWFASDVRALTVSLERFVGAAGYGLDELRGDVSRFAFLLGGDHDAAVSAGCER
jgi:hypothetical protein